MKFLKGFLITLAACLAVILLIILIIIILSFFSDLYGNRAVLIGYIGALIIFTSVWFGWLYASTPD